MAPGLTKKFALVEYKGGTSCVIESKTISVINDNKCIVKFRGAKYLAELIETSDSLISLQKLKTSIVKNRPADILEPSNQRSASKRFKPVSHSSPDNKTLLVSSPEDGIKNLSVNESFNNEDIDLSLNNSSAPPSGFSDLLSELDPHWPDVSTGINESSKDQMLFQASDSFDKNSTSVSDNKLIHEYTYNLSCPEVSIEKNKEVPFNEFSISEIIDSNNEKNIITNISYDNNVSTTDKCVNNSINYSTDHGQRNDDNLLLSTATGGSTEKNDDVSYNPEDTTNTFNLTSDNSTTSRPPLVLNSGGIDQTKLQVSKSGKRSEKSKLYFCIFCKELKTKFANHLIIRHGNESEVRDFMYLQKKSKRRAKLIATIRNRGTFLHNTNPDYNKGQLIVARRLHKNSTNTAEDFLACRNCGNSYSKLSIRFHVARCDPNKKNKERNVLKSGRALTNNIHPVACKLLRQKIFPILRAQDDEVKCIRYDELIIKYGNKLCNNYTLPHQHDMIRAKLRLLGKFKLEMLKLEKDMTVQFSDLFIPRLFDRAVEAIKVVAHWDPDLGYYKTPATAQSLSALVKACCSMVKSEFIKSENHEKERQADRFLHLWKEEIPVTIHKKALEDQSNLKRNKNIILPSQEDIKRLNDYLKKECEICLQRLNDEKQEFDRGAWLHLQECTLICIQLFNRRRAGEIERLTLENYENKKGIADDVDKKLLEKFSKNIQEYARQFIRITLRGKLSRTVSLLLTPFMTACIECILYFRQAANVKAENKFIFAKPGDNYLGKEYIRACPLMEKFSADCGASMPKTLRGTTLRKHVATYASLLNIEECQVDKLANFLGHNKDIHKNIYRMPVPISEITEVSKLLTLAVGDEIVDEEEEDSEEEEEEEEEEENEEVERANKIVQKRRERSEKSLENQKCKKAKRRKTTESNDHNEDNDNSKDDDNNNEDETDSDEKDDDYSSDDNDELIQQIKNSGKNKCTRLSIEKIKRIRWSKEEKDAVIEYFGNLEKLKKLPTLEQCQKLIDINPILQKRSATVVKAWISNQRVTKNFK